MGLLFHGSGGGKIRGSDSSFSSSRNSSWEMKRHHIPFLTMRVFTRTAIIEDDCPPEEGRWGGQGWFSHMVFDREILERKPKVRVIEGSSQLVGIIGQESRGQLSKSRKTWRTPSLSGGDRRECK